MSQTHIPPALQASVEKLDRDFYVYNGPIHRRAVLGFMELVKAHASRPSATLLMVTYGGDPDAGFKIARYMQHRYKHLSILISGVCKSAGTLVALGAHEVVFAPYGELGPLDIQMSKVDNFGQSQSGLVITDAINTLESRAIEAVFGVTNDLMGTYQGMISYQTATNVAVETMRAIYGPVLAQIDPEEIGTRSRAMRIAQDYGSRLIAMSNNAENDTLRILAETYSSHSFVIDHIEAEGLFKNSRIASEIEMDIVGNLGARARVPTSNPEYYALHAPLAANSEENDSAGTDPERPAAEDAGHPEGASEAPVSKSEPAAASRSARAKGT